MSTAHTFVRSGRGTFCTVISGLVTSWFGEKMPHESVEIQMQAGRAVEIFIDGQGAQIVGGFPLRCLALPDEWWRGDSGSMCCPVPWRVRIVDVLEICQKWLGHIG